MTDTDQVNLVELARGVTGLTVEVRNIGRRIGGIEKHILASDADSDALRLEAVKLRGYLEGKPCERHAERMRDQDRRISGLVERVGKGENTDRVMLSDIEVERARRDAADGERERIIADADRKWKRIAAVVGAAATILGAVGSRIVG